jgi:DNA-binding IclR family transcriptional regulator
MKALLDFLFIELKRSLKRSDVARISDLGTAADILFEFASETGETAAVDILKDVDYIVLHYDEEPQYIDKYLEKIERAIEVIA